MATKKAEVNEERGLIVPDFAVMKYEADKIGEIIRKNIGSGALQQSDLDRVKVPLGGMTTWTIPTIDGERDSKVLEGIIVAWGDVRAFWKEKYSGARVPPDCSSDDAETGHGDPGGVCDICPNAQFGTAVTDSDEPGEGQACRLMRVMAILQKDDLVPIILVAPPTSWKSMRKYFLRLAGRVLNYHDVVTSFTLASAQNKRGIKHSVIEAAVIGQLGTEEKAKIAPYVEVFSRSLQRGAARKYAE